MKVIPESLSLCVKDPVSFFYIWKSRLFKNKLYQRYQNMSNQCSLSKCYLILSFDCDTDDDIKVIWDLHRKLNDLGITPSYAVPGQLLEKGEREYSKVYESGAMFFNHGYQQHTYYNKRLNEFSSCYFYDQLSLSEVERDIVNGDRCLNKVFGMNIKGFRTPHFGTFQRSGHLNFLYKTLADLNYQFSSSTSPVFAFRYGPFFYRQGICEFPVTGMVRAPMNIYDTWAFFKAPDRLLKKEDYLLEAKKMSKHMSCGIINIYGDPSHIYDQPHFFSAMKELVSFATPASFGQFVKVDST